MKRITLHIIMLMGVALACHAYEPLPAVCDGSMMPYRLSVDQQLDMVAPDSLRPVMINYVARHGARYLSSAKKVNHLRGELNKASAENCLTETGKAFLSLLDRVDSATGGNWGALDPLGSVEQRDLALQMHALCPGLLSKGRVEAIATYVPRGVMSMYEFCHTLCRVAPDLEIHTAEGKQFNTLLRYFAADSLYVSYLASGKWRGIYDTYVAVLRFGHAETLMPLLSLMRLPGCDASAIHDCSKAYLTWRDYDVVPLGANLLIVTLKAPSGRLYTCLRLNGHWVSPVPDGRMLVPSSELTAYWRTLMADF